MSTEPHPAVAAALAALDRAIGPDGEVIIDWRGNRDASEQAGEQVDLPVWGDPQPLAASVAAAVLRWAAGFDDPGAFVATAWLLAQADEIEAGASSALPEGTTR